MSESEGVRFLGKAKCFGAGAIAGLLCAALLWVWNAYKPSLPAVLGQPAAKVAGIPTETKACTQVQALAPPAKKKLGLPEHVQKDEQASALTAANVPPSDHPLIATALLHRDSGLGEIYFTPQPMPWLAFNRRTAIGVSYGIKDDTNGFVTRLYGRLDIIQVKRLHAGLLADVDNAGGWYGGGYVEMGF